MAREGAGGFLRTVTAVRAQRTLSLHSGHNQWAHWVSHPHSLAGNLHPSSSSAQTKGNGLTLAAELESLKLKQSGSPQTFLPSGRSFQKTNRKWSTGSQPFHHHCPPIPASQRYAGSGGRQLTGAARARFFPAQRAETP